MVSARPSEAGIERMHSLASICAEADETICTSRTAPSVSDSAQHHPGAVYLRYRAGRPHQGRWHGRPGARSPRAGWESASRDKVEPSVLRSGAGTGRTYDAPCALDAELDAERAGGECAERGGNDPERDEDWESRLLSFRLFVPTCHGLLTSNDQHEDAGKVKVRIWPNEQTAPFLLTGWSSDDQCIVRRNQQSRLRYTPVSGSVF